MAVGRTGSFATVQPDTGAIDVAGMVKDQFDDVIALQDKERQLKGKIEEEKIGLRNKLKAPETAPTGEKNFDEIDYSVVSQLRDKQFDIEKQISSGKLSISEGRAKVASYNKALSDYVDQRKMYSPNVKNFVKLYKEGKVSRGMGDDLYGEYGLATAFIDGKIDDVKVDENGNVLFRPSKDKNYYSMSGISEMYGSPPLSLDFSTNISEITKDFKAQIKQDARTKFDDKGNIVSSYYYDTKTKTLSNAHKSVIYNEVSEIVNNPRLQNDLWWQMTGQKGKFDFETEEIIKMQEHFYNQAVQQARASIEEEFTEKFDRTQAGVDSRARNNEEKPSYIITGIPDYEREYRDVNGLYVVKNPNSVEERFPLKDDVEVVPNVTGIRISNKETGEQETELIKNFRLEKYFIDDEGNFVARGNKVTTLGESGSKETIGSDMESINIEDLRERRPAQTERISVILPLTEAGRVLASAGYNSEEIKSELDLMRSLQGTKSSVDETSKFNIEGEKKESSGFNLDEYLKEKGLK